MEECYTYEEVPITDRDIITDVSIVLIMENSNKANLEHIKAKVPSRKLIIQYNKGFNDCVKSDLVKNKSNFDLCHALKTALNHAFNILRLENVLILEEDAYFRDGVDSEHLNNIKSFISKNDFTIYNLGTFGFVGNPLSVLLKDHIKVLIYGGSHAVIYNKNIQKIDLSKCVHTDLYSWYHKNTFVYHKPLILQHLHTDSSNFDSFPLIGKVGFYLIHNIFGLFNSLPPKVEDFNMLYVSFKLLHLFIMFLYIWFCVILIKSYM